MAKTHFKKATMFSLLYSLFWIPMNVISNLMSDVEEKNGLGDIGFWDLAVIYLFQAGGSVVASAIISKYGLIKSMVVGSLLNCMMCGSSFLSSMRLSSDSNQDGWHISKETIIVALLSTSAISGFGQALTSVVQGEYIALCATEQTKGFYFGYYWFIF